MQLTGLLSFPLTPFGPNDTVDTDVLAEHIEAQVAAGPAGLFVACGTGEFTALSVAEYRQVLTTALKVAGGRLPVYAGVGGGPRIAREFLAAAAESGVDGALLLPPYLVQSPPAGVVDFVRYVTAATELPVVVYQRANAILDPAAAVALLDVPNVIGIKDGEGDLALMRSLIGAVRDSGHPRAADFGFFNGLPTAELSMVDYRAMGVPAYSSAVLCFLPEIATAFFTALSTEDDETVGTLLREFYIPFGELRKTTPGYAVSLIKAGARLGGLPVGPVRPPLPEVTPEHLSQLQQLITRARTALDRLVAGSSRDKTDLSCEVPTTRRSGGTGEGAA